MTTVNDFLVDANSQNGKSTFDGRHLAIGAAQRLIGFSFLLAAVGMWILPGTSWSLDLAVMKLGVSTFFGVFGFMIMHLGHDAS